MDGLNLFFGALLGANLGTFEGLKLVHYILLIALLASMVMALRMVSTTGARREMLLLPGLYAISLLAVVASPSLRPDGLAAEDLHRLIATMFVWIGIGLVIELSPVAEDSIATSLDSSSENHGR